MSHVKPTLTLDFLDSDSPQLERVIFNHALLNSESPIVSTRGRNTAIGSGYAASGVFPWSSGVKALCQLLLQAVDEPEAVPYLIGGKGSPAGCLDAALSKSPSWLIDLFGVDSSGQPIFRRVFRRSNPEGKRPGDIGVALNHHFLPPEAMTIKIGGKLPHAKTRRDIIKILAQSSNTTPPTTRRLLRRLPPLPKPPEAELDNPHDDSLQIELSKIFASAASHSEALDYIEIRMEAAYEKVYEGYPSLAYAELGRIQRIVRANHAKERENSASLLARAGWMRCRCLTDMSLGGHFRRALSESEDVLRFSGEMGGAERAPALWASGALRRMELLNLPVALRSRKAIRETIEITEAAASFTVAERSSENLKIQIELGKLALLSGNHRLYEKYSDRASFYCQRLSNHQRYLGALFWDLRARGHLRFGHSAENALTQLKQARQVLASTSKGRKFRAIELYLANTELQALQQSGDPTLIARQNKLRTETLLEAHLLGNRFQGIRATDQSLSGL